MNKSAWAMLVTLSVVWGGSFFFVSAAVRELPPLTIVFARLFLGAVVLCAVIAATGKTMPKSPQMWMAFAIIGFLANALPFSLITWGQTHISGGLASILNGMTPLTTVIVAHFFSGSERMTAAKITGVLAGIAGAALIIGTDALAGLGDNVLAQLAVLAATCSYAFASVYGLRFRKWGVSPLSIAAGQTTCSSIMILPLMLWIESPWTLPAPSIQTWAALGGLSILSTALAYILYFRIIAVAGATNVALVAFLMPVSAILLGVLFLGEVLEAKHFYGMVLIGIGLAFIDGRLIKKFPSKLS